jgi:hypothetical protein
MGLHRVTTTLMPGKEIIVDDAALTDLTRDGILAEDLGEVEELTEDDLQDEGMKEAANGEAPDTTAAQPSDVAKGMQKQQAQATSNAAPSGSGATA